MKSILTFSVLVLGVLLMTVADVSARGGGGGGGRGGGGGGGGGGGSRGGGGGGGGARPTAAPAGRSPSVSASNRPAAATARPSTPKAGAGGAATAARPNTGARPSAGDVNNFVNVPKSGAAGARAGGAVAAGAAGGAAAEFLNGGGAGKAAVARSGAENRGAGERAGARQEARATNRPERTENRQERADNRGQRRDEIRNQVRDNHPVQAFWNDHPGWAAMAITRPFRWATWGAVGGWFGGGYGEPAAYDYGSDVYYEDDTVYAGDQTIPAEQYTEQAAQIATSAADASTEKMEWMPLGVFALTEDGQASGPDPTMFVQLAISKEGIIGGTFNNSATNETQAIEGAVDKKSQRAAWAVKGKSRPIMETGLSNLTADTGSALVHFADGSTQQILLVRLEEPKETK